MKRHFVLAGRGLAGIGFASGLGYLIATKASGIKNPPVWPYLICAGVLITGIAVYLIGDAQLGLRLGRKKEFSKKGPSAELNVHEPSRAFTHRWRSTSDGPEIESLMELGSTVFSHRGYTNPTYEKPPTVRIGTPVQCAVLESTLSGTELRSRFRNFLTQQSIMSIVAAMTRVDHNEKWISLAGNGRLMLEASLMAEDQETAPIASAMLMFPAKGKSPSANISACAELRLHIERRTADGIPARPMMLVDWQARFARALSIPELFADFLSNDLGLVTSGRSQAKFGMQLRTPGPLTEMVDIGGLKALPGNSIRDQFIGCAIADSGGISAMATAREFIMQLCEALNLDDYEWAFPPVVE